MLSGARLEASLCPPSRTAERGPAPRAHHRILVDGSDVGEVTSGGYSPSLGANVGLGYVPTSFTAAETRLRIDVRGRPVAASVAPLPFYARPR